MRDDTSWLDGGIVSRKWMDKYLYGTPPEPIIPLDVIEGNMLGFEDIVLKEITEKLLKKMEIKNDRRKNNKNRKNRR